MGMIMLECGHLKSQIDCYKDDCGRVDQKALNNSLNRFGNEYSDGLKEMVEFMLRKEAGERPDWLELEKHVRRVDGSQNNPNNTNAKNVNERFTYMDEGRFTITQNNGAF